MNAFRHGHDEVARLLLTAGAKSVPEPEDELRIALQALDETRVGELLAVQPGLIELRIPCQGDIVLTIGAAGNVTVEATNALSCPYRVRNPAKKIPALF